MKREDLKNIYEEYLERQPLHGDYEVHIKKDKHTFINEIINCKEYNELQRKKKESLKNNEEWVIESNVGKIINPIISDSKVAVVLSGHIRNNKVLSFLNKRTDIDVFCHTWDQIGNKGYECDVKSEDSPFIPEITRSLKKFTNLKRYKIEKNKNIVDKWYSQENLSLLKDVYIANLSSPEPFLYSQFYSIQQSFKLLKDYVNETGKTYDTVIKLRFDSTIQQLDLDEFSTKKQNEYNLIFCPNNGCHPHPGRLDRELNNGCEICNRMYYDEKIFWPHSFSHSNVICDFYALGSYKSMEHYCNVFDYFIPYLIKHSDYNKKVYEYFKNRSDYKNFTLNFVPEFGYNSIRIHHFGGTSQQNHLNSIRNFYCSYPESVLREHLKDYMVVAANHCKINMSRGT